MNERRPEGAPEYISEKPVIVRSGFATGRQIAIRGRVPFESYHDGNRSSTS